MIDINSCLNQRILRTQESSDNSGNYVLYWMQQAQRIENNPALDFAVLYANKLQIPLRVCFILSSEISNASAAHYRFMLQGLMETAKEAYKQHLSFSIYLGTFTRVISVLAKEARVLVLDHGCLLWQKKIRNSLFTMDELKHCNLYELDTEAVVPIHLASTKEEYSAATLRRKIIPQLNTWLCTRPKTRYFVQLRPQKALGLDEFNGNYEDEEALWEWSCKRLNIESSCKITNYQQGSHKVANRILDGFIDLKLKDYAMYRNHPDLDIQSNMSAYLHFGQISSAEIIRKTAEKCGIALKNCGTIISGKAQYSGLYASFGAYAEELIIRRELAMNFCEYNPEYESAKCLPKWAKNTLTNHLNDVREQDYAMERLESGETDDIYWNAAQKELLNSGKMHNYMRMYWGKRVLAWCPSVDEAYQILAYLNNRYELDGRDANAWAGIAWCFGKHDRPWAERPIYGMVRYMNAAGLKRKFNMKAYTAKWLKG